MPPLGTPDFGIDTSVFVRLLTGHPDEEYESTLQGLRATVEHSPTARFFVSNQVVGEAYVVLQHHYGLAKSDARERIGSLLAHGPMEALGGAPVLRCLASEGDPGLVDRLIALDYAAHGLDTLTRDRRMARLPGVRVV
jgi:predicted nucleic-acid-binding protein